MSKTTKNIGPDTLLLVDGISREVTPENGKNYTLKELYALLGCSSVEVVYPRGKKDYILICDDEGMFVSEPKVNHAASLINGDGIVGNALLCHTSRLK